MNALPAKKGLPYIDQELNIIKLPDDVAVRQLGRIVNASLIGKVQDGGPVTNRRYRYGICSMAEQNWAGVHTAIRHSRPPGVQLFVAGVQPIIARKGIGKPTGILLQSMVLGSHGVEYPPGTIVQLQTDCEDQYISRYGDLITPPDTDLIVTPASQLHAVTFGRLSALALPKIQQEQHFGCDYHTPRTTIDDLGAALSNLVPNHDAFTDYTGPLPAGIAISDLFKP